MNKIEEFDRDDMDVVSFVDIVQDIFTLYPDDIDKINDSECPDRVYDLINYVDVVFMDLIDLVDIKVLNEERLYEIMFSVRCIMTFIDNNFTSVHSELVFKMINHKLDLVKDKAVGFEYFEIATNFQNFRDLYYELFN